MKTNQPLNTNQSCSVAFFPLMKEEEQSIPEKKLSYLNTKDLQLYLKILSTKN